MTDSSILVLGATGTTGRRVAAALRSAGHRVRAASRRPHDGAADDWVPFDWDDPETWVKAIGDATALYLMAPDGTPIDPRFVKQAVDSGVRRIVLLSSGAIEEMGDQRLLDAERTVKESGVDWTILRASWFDQNFDEGFLADAVKAGEIALPLGDVRQAFVDADDIAAVAAVALTEDGHAGRVYPVTGPEGLSFERATEIISSAAGVSVRYLGSAEDFVRAQTAIGLPEDAARGAVQAFEALQALGDQEPTDVVRRVAGREPKSFERYAAEAAKAWTG